MRVAASEYRERAEFQHAEDLVLFGKTLRNYHLSLLDAEVNAFLGN